MFKSWTSAWWVVPTSYFALLIVVFFPYLFSGAVFLDSDITTQYYAYFDFYHKALTANQSFLWNPLLFSGFPAYLSQVGGFFDPLNYVLFQYLDAFTGLHIRLVIDYSLLLTFSYVAGRVWGLSRAAAFCVGLAYMMSFNQVYVSNPLFANSAFIMPFLVWILGRFKTAARFEWKWAFLGGVGVGFAFLGGYAQPIIMALTLFGMLGVVLALMRPELDRGAFFLRFAAFSTTIAATGFAIGAVQIVPALDFVELTRRGVGVGYSLASLKSVVPGDIILFLFPDYNYFPYISVGRKALYVGAIWFLLALGMLRVLVYTRQEKAHQEAFAFGVIFLIALCIAIKHSPIFYLLQQLPVFSLFRFADRWMYVGSFFLAMLGGFGLDAITRSAGERYLQRWYAIITTPIVLFVAAIAFLNAASSRVLEYLAHLGSSILTPLYGHGPFVKGASHYEDAFVRGISAWQEFTSFTDPAFGLPMLMLVLSGGLLTLHLGRAVSPQRMRLGTVALMMATFVISVSFQFEDRLTRENVMKIQRNSFMRFIPQEDRQLYRYYPFMVDAGFGTKVPPSYRLSSEHNKASGELAYATGWPNTNFLLDMPTLDGYDVFVPQVHYDALADSGSTFGGQDATRALAVEEKIARFERNLDVIGMMGGKYIVTGREFENRDLKLVGTYIATRLDLPFYVYENTHALPRVYIAERVTAAPGLTLAEMMQGVRTFNVETFIDCDKCDLLSGEGSIEAMVFQNGYASFDVQAKDSLWLVFSESNLPGWEARIDGVPIEIIRTNGIYMAVRVPTGSHTVEFRYHGSFI